VAPKSHQSNGCPSLIFGGWLVRDYLQSRTPTLPFWLGKQLPTDYGRRVMQDSDSKFFPGVNITDALRTGAFSAAFREAPPQPDPNTEVLFRKGCADLGFSSREEFKAKQKAQRAMIERGEKILGAVLPMPHDEKSSGSKFFYQHEIDAYNAAKKSAG
jgi:hypothetical protein